MHHARRPRDDELHRQVSSRAGLNSAQPAPSILPSFFCPMTHPTHLRRCGYIFFPFYSRQPIPILALILSLISHHSRIFVLIHIYNVTPFSLFLF